MVSAETLDDAAWEEDVPADEDVRALDEDEEGTDDALPTDEDVCALDVLSEPAWLEARDELIPALDDGWDDVAAEDVGPDVEAGVLVHLPSTQKVPAAQTGSMPQRHSPTGPQPSALSPHALHVDPLKPHASTVGSTHWSCRQQPVGQDSAVQTHLPSLHCCPG